ncbi:hypothetical protein [Blastopirellula marina]|uniref:hypothetical protein n=1 Tax=Blastopirellula marina TaxID=124 RepID=UPI00031F8816|nr:hypothetical protein [Blastopirellula marina]
MTGTITVNGSPPEGAMIKLIKLGEPVDSRKSDCWALVKEDGSYSFSTYEVGDGVPKGEYAWILRWPQNSMQLVPDKLGEEFWSLEEPYMTVTVDGRTELSPVELTNVKLK